MKGCSNVPCFILELGSFESGANVDLFVQLRFDVSLCYGSFGIFALEQMEKDDTNRARNTSLRHQLMTMLILWMRSKSEFFVGCRAYGFTISLKKLKIVQFLQ